MFKLLTNIFIKNNNNTSDPKIRKSYATLASVYGIILNIILFAAKYVAGLISGSLAITADALNNLSDAGSSVIAFVGFYLAGKRPDSKHPYGYGRIEYITGFIISAIIIVVGVELGISSVRKIISPEPIEVSLIPVVIMGLAILVKFYMFTYNRYAGNVIDSAALKATATDSLTDCIATFVTLVSIGLVFFFRINVDGYAGLLVSLFVLYAGITSAIDTVSPILGKAPDKELITDIEQVVMSHPEIKGIHDLMIHDYGPGNLIISLHCEVDGKADIFEAHDTIDCIENELNDRFNAVATIHMDPIDLENEQIPIMKEKSLEVIHNIYPDSSIHDFRMVPGPTHTNLIFDIVLPTKIHDNDEEAKEKINKAISSSLPGFFSVVHIDRSYIE